MSPTCPQEGPKMAPRGLEDAPRAKDREGLDQSEGAERSFTVPGCVAEVRFRGADCCCVVVVDVVVDVIEHSFLKNNYC